MTILFTCIMLGILVIIFIKLVGSYEDSLRNSQVATDIDHELMTILYSNVDCPSLDAKYNGLTFAEVIGFTMKDMEDIYNLGNEKDLNHEQVKILSCLYSQGGLGLTAYVNDKVMRFYVEYDDIDEDGVNKKLLYTYSTPDGMTYSESAKDLIFIDCLKENVVEILSHLFVNPLSSITYLWDCGGDAVNAGFDDLEDPIKNSINTLYKVGRWTTISTASISGGVVCSRLGGLPVGLLCGETTGIKLNEMIPDSVLLFDNEKNDLKDVAKITIPIYPNGQATVYLEMWDKWTEG
ncbi:MAG: hypothetical protein KAJ47_01575 [Candidatus Aenigmarchaeota archaeon]|nr:hypothetical protein [Candidatus Aenigmarchaeota archaeon]